MTLPRLTRRAFVKSGIASAAFAAAGLGGSRRARAGSLPDWRPGEALPWRNWSGMQRCVPAARLGPTSEDELRSLLRAARPGLRPAGAGHSFSALVPTDGALVFLDALSGVIAADPERRQAEVWAGTRLHLLGPALAAAGQALPNLPDIDQQTLGGALATSTHGTGAALGSLSSAVIGLSLATPRGELLECDASRNAEVFHAARSSLGALGIVTRVRLQNRAAHRLVERTRFLPLDDVLADPERAQREHRHFEFYAFPHSSVALAIETDETDAAPETPPPDDPEALYTLRSLFRTTRWLPGGDSLYDAFLRRQKGTQHVDDSYQVLTHSRTLRFNEMEYTVPAKAGPACLREILDTIRARALPVCFPIECRRVREDDVWLSMFGERAGFSISVHQFAEDDPWPYFKVVEPIFWKYEGRPHWGKLHSLGAAQLAALYPHWRDFQAVRRSLDPQGLLVNEHLGALLGT